MSQVPEPWASAMVKVGFTDPRYDDPRPSMSRLAEAAGLHTTTVSRMVRETKQPDPENVAHVAKALRQDVREVSEWVRQAGTVAREYRVPAEVNLLTQREQDAISELIRAIAATREAVVGNAESSTAPIGDDETEPSRNDEQSVVPPSAEGNAARRGPTVSRIEGHGPSRTNTSAPRGKGRRRSGGSRPS